MNESCQQSIQIKTDVCGQLFHNLHNFIIFFFRVIWAHKRHLNSDSVIGASQKSFFQKSLSLKRADFITGKRKADATVLFLDWRFRWYIHSNIIVWDFKAWELTKERLLHGALKPKVIVPQVFFQTHSSAADKLTRPSSPAAASS